MATNTGFLLMAGLGALLFLGRGGAAKTTDEDNRMLAGQGRSGPTPTAFDLQTYIADLFGEIATVPEQPAMAFFYPANQVVTSSGVPGISSVAADLITPTTKVQIGGAGGETITASALAVRRSEQIAKQEFEYAANVFAPPPGETEKANRIEEARQLQVARDRIAKNIADQLARNRAVDASTRAEQERLANPFSLAALPIVVPGLDTYVPGPKYSETFVISGGMDSPFADSPTRGAFDFPVEMWGSEYDDPGPDYYAPSIYVPPVTVHEVTAAYDIGF